MDGNKYPANPPNIDLSIPKPVAEQLARDILTEATSRIAADTALGRRIDWAEGNMGEFDHSELNERDADDAHPQSAITGLVDALALKAPLASPALTGTPTAPTPTAGDDSTKIATTEFVTDAVAEYPQSGYVAGRGWWQKHADGTLVQWGIQFSVTTSYSFGTGYYGFSISAFPIPFVREVPSVSPSNTKNGGYGIMWVGLSPVDLYGVAIYLIAPGAGWVGTVSYIAVGRWKA